MTPKEIIIYFAAFVEHEEGTHEEFMAFIDAIAQGWKEAEEYIKYLDNKYGT